LLCKREDSSAAALESSRLHSNRHVKTRHVSENQEKKQAYAEQAILNYNCSARQSKLLSGFA